MNKVRLGCILAVIGGAMFVCSIMIAFTEGLHGIESLGIIVGFFVGCIGIGIVGVNDPNANLSSSKKETKSASVVKRAAAGGIIAGPAGAVVGAISAADKNNRTGAKGTDGKNASVVKRAAAGGIIAGPAGAVVGAVSAADKNNRNKRK